MLLKELCHFDSNLHNQLTIKQVCVSERDREDVIEMLLKSQGSKGHRWKHCASQTFTSSLTQPLPFPQYFILNLICRPLPQSSKGINSCPRVCRMALLPFIRASHPMSLDFPSPPVIPSSPITRPAPTQPPRTNVFSLCFCDQLWFSPHIHTGNYSLDIFIWTLQKHPGPKHF